MRTPERLIAMGMILTIVGLILFILPSMPAGSGFFFVFPFIFVGEVSGPLLVIVLAFVVIFFLVFFMGSAKLLPPNWIDGDQNRQEKYTRLSSICGTCGMPTPESAVYCPSCGSELGENRADYHEP